MCGFLGLFRFDTPLSARQVDLARASLYSMAHRGPDGQGEWLVSRAYLGHRRLKILDLSDNAAQPFASPCGRFHMAYNGEIYNYLELRAELEPLGYTFKSASDTEVFLAAFMEWGERAAERFDGMFAAVIHDSTLDVIHLLRDPLGQKPLYVYVDNSLLACASELRGLLALDLPLHISRSNFWRFLAASYYPWSHTPVNGVIKFPAGHTATVRQGRMASRRYFHSVPGHDVLTDISENEAVDEIARLLDRSCEMSLRSDVPYGVFLSGGVDSSLVLESCLRLNPEVSAFSVAMSEADFDESDKARSVAQTLGVRRHMVFSMDRIAVRECYQEFCASLDEPHGDPGYVNALFLARSCRAHLTVGLAGDGGDELFCGYAPFRALGLAWLRYLPALAASGARTLAAKLLPGADTYLSMQFKVLSALRASPSHPDALFGLWLSTEDPEVLGGLAKGDTGPLFERSARPGTVYGYASEALEDCRRASLQQRLMTYYQRVFLPEFVCMHTDRAAMRHGLEVRSPFLSVPLIAFANRLPDSLRMGDGQLKRPLRALMAKRGFTKALTGQAKQGFTFPLARWLKSELRPEVDSLFVDDTFEGLLHGKALLPLWEAHLSGRANHYRLFFNLLAFRAWRKNFPSLSFGDAAS